MRIGIDGILLESRRTGMGRYLESLLRRWAEKPGGCSFRVYYLNEKPDDAFLNAPAITLQKLRFRFPEDRDVFERELRENPVDLFFSPYYDLPDCWDGPSVITVHDMVFEAFPQMYDPAVLDCFRRRHGICLKRAKKILTISDFSRREIQKYFPHTDPLVIPLAPSPVFGPEERGEKPGWLPRGPFIFCAAGSIMPKRPVGNVIEAFRKAEKRLSQWSLVITGKDVTAHTVPARQLVDAANAEFSREKIVYREFISDGDLAAAYRSAEIFVWLSLYEGFGLPPLEAMASGTAVLTSCSGSLPEVTGDGALQLADIHDAGAIAEQLTILAENASLREALALKGLERSRSFSWEKTADRTLEILKNTFKELQ